MKNPIVTTLNPVFNLALVAVALIGLDNELASSNGCAFVLGALAAIPLIVKIWGTMEKNWPLYRKFYSLEKRDMKIVNRSWSLTMWIVPYTVLVYAALDAVILFYPRLGTTYGLLSGAVFVISGYTFLKCQKYYNDLSKPRK